MRKSRSRSLLLLLPLIVIMASSCGIHGRYDAKGLRDDRACLVPEKLISLEPPLGHYEDQGIRLDYDRLVPRPDPRKGADISYYREAYDDPRSVEQLYYDASQGNERARWLICIMESSARFIGRESARYMSSLNCQTITSCRLRFDALPFSQQTASGARLLAEVGKGVAAQSKIEGAKQELVGHALVLLVGARVASSQADVPGRPVATSSAAGGGSGGRLFWGFWKDYPKVTVAGREYAQIGGRLYTRHAIERMLPSGLGAPAGSLEAGRSIAPAFIEQAIATGTPSTQVVGGVTRTIYTSGGLRVVTEEAGRIVITIIPGGP